MVNTVSWAKENNFIVNIPSSQYRPLTNFKCSCIINSFFTAKIIKTYVEKYPFIKYYYKDNGGQSSARNYGIDKARGCYLWFVDSDD